MKKLLVLLLFAASPAWGQAFVNGNMLHGWFQGPKDYATAMTYVLGAYDALKLMAEARKICLFDSPPGVTSGQVVDVVKLYLEKHPEGRNYGAGGIVYSAVSEAWPCKK